jgi:hypothetical protein
MRSGLWSRRLSRWRTRKSLPTDQAALRAAPVTARGVFHGRGLAGRAGERRWQADGFRRDEQGEHHGVHDGPTTLQPR